MQINIQSSFRISGDLDILINEQLKKLNKYYNKIVYADVFLKKEPDAVDHSEIKVHLGIPGPDIIVTTKSGSFEKSLNTAVKTLRRNLIKRIKR